MRKLTVLILLAAVILGVSRPACAAEVLDRTRDSSLTLVMSWDGKPLENGSLTLYRVGDIIYSDGGYGFTPVSELKDTGISLKKLNDTELPGKLEALAVLRKLGPIRQSVSKGEAVFSELQPGLYVVTQTEKEACDGFEPIRPFLMSLPQWDGKTYVYDRKAQPKVALEKIPEQPATTEPHPTEQTAVESEKSSGLPQTGQLNWPVPVMAVSGFMLLLVGSLLRGRKKDSNEA